MTIRYKCEECSSVLKIRDELAGNSAKCPKCKTEFTIPEADTADKPEAASAEVEQDPVDMPREITPFPDLSSQRNEDSPPAAAVSTDTDSELKPSVAELMREHEAQKQKKKEKKKKGGLAEAAAVAEVVTSGTAADALTRNYDQKRGKASERLRPGSRHLD